MNRPSREHLRELERENRRWPPILKEIQPHEWPSGVGAAKQAPFRVLRSSEFLVQCFDERQRNGGDALIRMSVNRTSFDPIAGRWTENITWDDLQRLKREAGYGDQDAVEVFPADRQVVNVANMRHLWIFDSPLPFAWRRP